jgi:hypothetical protein
MTVVVDVDTGRHHQLWYRKSLGTQQFHPFRFLFTRRQSLSTQRRNNTQLGGTSVKATIWAFEAQSSGSFGSQSERPSNFHLCGVHLWAYEIGGQGQEQYSTLLLVNYKFNTQKQNMELELKHFLRCIQILTLLSTYWGSFSVQLGA